MLLLVFQSLPETTYQDMSKQVFLKPMYSEQDNQKAMVTKDTLKYTNIDR